MHTPEVVNGAPRGRCPSAGCPPFLICCIFDADRRAPWGGGGHGPQGHVPARGRGETMKKRSHAALMISAGALAGLVLISGYAKPRASNGQRPVPGPVE